MAGNSSTADVDISGTGGDATVAFLNSIGEGPVESALLASARIAVVGGGSKALECKRAIERTGVGTVERIGWEASSGKGDFALTVVAPEPVELPLVADWNTAAFAARSAWMQVLPFDGRITAIGPLYEPAVSSCYECFLRRRAANVEYGFDNFWDISTTEAPYPSLPGIDRAAAGLAATIVVRWLAQQQTQRTVTLEDPPLTGAMWALEWGSSLGFDAHYVHEVPLCSLCSSVRREGVKTA